MAVSLRLHRIRESRLAPVKLQPRHRKDRRPENEAAVNVPGVENAPAEAMRKRREAVASVKVVVNARVVVSVPDAVSEQVAVSVPDVENEPDEVRLPLLAAVVKAHRAENVPGGASVRVGHLLPYLLLHRNRHLPRIP